MAEKITHVMHEKSVTLMLIAYACAEITHVNGGDACAESEDAMNARTLTHRQGHNMNTVPTSLQEHTSR